MLAPPRTFVSDDDHRPSMITLYDIPSTLPGSIWSRNTIKARIVLNYKRIPYATEWVEYPRIQSKLLEIGGKPTSKKSDGTDHYTLPAIQDTGVDGDKNVVVTDSWEISEYLDTAYPDVQKVFPEGTKTAIAILEQKFSSDLSPVNAAIIARVGSSGLLNPVSDEFFRRTREESFGKKLEEMLPVEGENAKCWEEIRGSLFKIAEVYRKNNTETVDGCSWYFGNTFSYADAITIAYLVWIREAYGKDSAEWRAIEGVADGFWRKQVERGEREGLLDVK